MDYGFYTVIDSILCFLISYLFCICNNDYDFAKVFTKFTEKKGSKAINQLKMQ